MKTRTVDVLSLWSAGNLQGQLQWFLFVTSKALHLFMKNVTLMKISQKVLDWLKNIIKKEEPVIGLFFCDSYNNDITHDAITGVLVVRNTKLHYMNIKL